MCKHEGVTRWDNFQISSATKNLQSILHNKSKPQLILVESATNSYNICKSRRWLDNLVFHLNSSLR